MHNKACCSVETLGCGRVFEDTPEQMYRSINKIMELSAVTMAYPTHEYSLANLKFAMAVDGDNEALKVCQDIRTENAVTLPTRLAQEAAINPFLRIRDAAIIASAEAYQKRALNSPSEVFQHLGSGKMAFSRF